MEVKLFKPINLYEMEKILKYSVGIDMSMDKFDACISVLDVHQNVIVRATKSFNNNYKGFVNFFQWIKKHRRFPLSITFTIEATGVYHEQLVLFLFEKGCYISIVLPNKSKHYLKSIGLKSKNDKIDSKGLSRMGAEQKLKNWEPCSKIIYQLRLKDDYYLHVPNNQVIKRQHL